jgi:SAM-dependent methyltransferase
MPSGQRRKPWARTGRTAPPASGKTAIPSGTPPGTWPDTRLFPAEATLPMPDPSLQNQVGPPGVFHDVGLTTMGRLNMAGLRPDHDVLDIGCGVGRTARYLCDYLDAESHYEGFDIMEQLIEWCQGHITPLFPNFRFRFVPVFNSAYLPDPSLPSASELRFPYPDESFDFVFAHSVFTHLSPDASINYLGEINRVLRPGGRCYSTWFLFEDDPATNVSPLIAGMHLDASGDFAFHNPKVPDTAVGYRETVVRRTYASCGLTIVDPIHPGFTKLQDAVVALK